MIDNYYVFDLDGTLANIDHRLHYLDRKDWDGFFDACVDDKPILPVIEVLINLVKSGSHVEIWSGRSSTVANETMEWLDKHIKIHLDTRDHKTFRVGHELLTQMRKEGDYRPDTVIKKEWLDQFEDQYGRKPDMIFDDRQSVVDMWRDNDVICAQVASWDDRKHFIAPLQKNEPQLILMVGPSGAGKSKLVNDTSTKNFPSGFFRIPTIVSVSTDELRQCLCGDFREQERNDDVFRAAHAITKTHLQCGLPVIVDSTNLRAKERKAYINIALSINPDMKIQYTVVDRPLQTKHETAGWRKDITVKNGQLLIDYHHNIFQQNVKDILAGDNHPNVTVVDMRDKQK